MRREMSFFLTAAIATLSIATAHAATWTYAWPANAGDPVPKVVVSPMLYGKAWAYAVEIDDGAIGALTVVQPLLAKFEFTDAPPGVAGGRAKPFVGGAAVVVQSVNGNAASLNYEQLRSLRDRGWGVINHSYFHAGRSWGDSPENLTEPQIRRDLFWSQTVLSAELGGRAPTHFVYPNGYVGYRGPWMGEYGLHTASRVAGASGWDPANVKFQPLDLNRNYLDEGNWAAAGKGEPMRNFPKDGPAPGDVFIDFTHGIDAKPESPNHRRWTERLTTIATAHGKTGRDDVWSTSTGDAYAYVAARGVAQVSVEAGRLSVMLPDELPGTPLTIELTGVPATTELPAVAGGIVYRAGDRAWVTTPTLNAPGSAAPRPQLRRVYEGPVKDVTFEKPIQLAGVRVRQGSPPTGKFEFQVTAVGPGGESTQLVPPAGETLGRRWGTWLLLDVLPGKPAIEATRVIVPRDSALNAMEVWAVTE